MADPREPLQRHQSRLLQGVAALGVFTDASLAAYCGEVGVEVDRTTLTRYRAGERQAPLGLLPLMLHHAGEDAGAVLNLLAAPHGLRVVASKAAEASGDLIARTFRVAGDSGAVVEAVGAALADGHLSDDERAGIRELAARLRQSAAELEALVSTPARRSAR